MKLLILTCTIILLSFQISSSQSNYKGIALKNFNGYSAGDTIDIFGFKQNSYGKSTYLINAGTYEKYVSSAKLELLDDDLDFWQVVLYSLASALLQPSFTHPLKDPRKEYGSFMVHTSCWFT